MPLLWVKTGRSQMNGQGHIPMTPGPYHALAPSPCHGSTRMEMASATCCPSAGKAAPVGRLPGCPVLMPSTSSTAMTASIPTHPLRSRSEATITGGMGLRASLRSCTQQRKVGWWAWEGEGMPYGRRSKPRVCLGSLGSPKS